ncbi:hypothetical protein [Enterovirga rhinocerotis]|uniref:DUF2336 domain-containing protein n=1 Tax=Enterovirga rhinocerotis TaxID=1339210 RepID=A0A4R7BT68_9HYPH|nr:hypothetical protein [Enterovirga rhinocerotis]TDR88944.1 hypothetical protein EV668_3429 [Enterovirga rhinocerotis]
MRPRSAPDLSTLARLAQNPAAELRPLLLRVQAQTFADAQRRDEAMAASFEAIALGLIPLVSDDVVADIAAILDPIPDAPRRVLGALDARLGRRASSYRPSGHDQRHPDGRTPSEDLQAVLSRQNPALDLAIAKDQSVVLDGRALSILVDRAVHQRDLARALLARRETGRFDRAALYRHADAATRASIRHDLASVGALSAVLRPAGLGADIPAILAAAEMGDFDSIADLAESRLGCDRTALDLNDPAGRELFALTLLALGLDDAECIRVVILLASEASRSVGTMTELAQLVRTTPWPVAAFLAGRDGPRRRSRTPTPGGEPTRAAGTLRADGRSDAAGAAPRLNPAEPVRAHTAQAGHRS